jgi:hypothetical protein
MDGQRTGNKSLLPIDVSPNFVISVFNSKCRNERIIYGKQASCAEIFFENKAEDHSNTHSDEIWRHRDSIYE